MTSLLQAENQALLSKKSNAARFEVATPTGDGGKESESTSTQEDKGTDDGGAYDCEQAPTTEQVEKDKAKGESRGHEVLESREYALPQKGRPNENTVCRQEAAEVLDDYKELCEMCEFHIGVQTVKF